jgi:GT2 family glycosyltransferase
LIDRGAARWLTILVHFEALTSHPLRYGKAAFWRLLRKRWRSRSQFAPILGRSRHAYPLWIAKHEPRAWERHRQRARAPESDPSIFLILEADDQAAGAVLTLDGLRSDGVRDPVLMVARTPPPMPADDPLAVRCFPDREKLQAFLAGCLPCWILPMRPGDLLAPGALDIYRSIMREDRKPALLYADNDVLCDGRRTRPHFKPGWNDELFQQLDYISNSSVIQLADERLLRLVGEHADWQRQMVLALRSDQPAAATHLPLVLHHHRQADVRPVPARRCEIPLDAALPRTTIIIPTRNRHDLLDECLASVAALNYPKFDILVVDNDSDDPQSKAYLDRLERDGTSIMRFPGPFNFSAMNNAAVARTDSDLICFLNNDVEALEPGWLSTMALQAVRSDVGAVGAKLLYPDRTIQHAGVVLGINGGAGHAHRFQRNDDPGYFERVHLPQFASAVTAACMVVSRRKFLAVGGFDETAFPVAFNDVDLCLKLNARGWQSFYEPRAVLVHHESKSRGKDVSAAKRTRFACEFLELQKRWNTGNIVDPFHHPELSHFSEQFVVRT